MSPITEFQLDHADVETLRRIKGRMNLAAVGGRFLKLLPFLSIGGSAIVTSVSVSTFPWGEWEEAVRSNVFDALGRRASRNAAFYRWHELEGVDAKRDPHIHARRMFWERLYEKL
jgi:hypothetical protein